MFDFKLTKEFVQFKDEVENWEEAIVESSRPLLDAKLIKESYVDAMIESVKEHGPYIVIAPNIALPHARPEAGSIKVGFSILKLEKPVAFSKSDEHKAQLLIALSCVDSSTHIEMLQTLVTILSDEEKYNRILEAKTEDEIVSIFA